MRLPSKLALAGATVALAITPAVALATTSSSTRSGAEKACRSLQKTDGKTTFDAAYGTNKNGKNAFGKCVSKTTSQDAADQTTANNNAAKTCKTQENDTNFAADYGHPGQTFAQFYGTNHNDSNAYGKCVSTLAKSMTSSLENSQTKAQENAAHQCKTQENDTNFAADYGHPGQTFAQFYGTNHSDSNAFGKCVSKTARAQ